MKGALQRSASNRGVFLDSLDSVKHKPQSQLSKLSTNSDRHPFYTGSHQHTCYTVNMSSTVKISSASQLNDLLKNTSIVVADCKCHCRSFSLPRPMTPPYRVRLEGEQRVCGSLVHDNDAECDSVGVQPVRLSDKPYMIPFTLNTCTCSLAALSSLACLRITNRTRPQFTPTGAVLASRLPQSTRSYQSLSRASSLSNSSRSIPTHTRTLLLPTKSPLSPRLSSSAMARSSKKSRVPTRGSYSL